MAQMLAMVCNEHQNDWDVHLPHVEYAYNNSVSAATGLAPNEVHMGRLPRLPLTVFDRSYGGMHQNLDSTNSPIATLPASVNNEHTNLCENNTPSPSLGLTGAAPPSPMPSSAAPNTRLVDRSGYTTPPPPSAKRCVKTPTTKFSKRNSRSTGLDPSR